MAKKYMSRIELINFQSHKSTIVDLHPGINGIIAPSNVGKSSIVRIVSWVLYNDISGEPNYINKASDTAIGRIHFSDGTIIEREIHAPDKGNGRKVKKNFYRIYQADQLLHEITGFGTKVPQLVQEAHQMMPENPKMNLHFWNQLDRPFLVTDKPVDRAQAMGNLDELRMVDTSLIEVNSEILANTKTKNTATSRIENIEAEIKLIEQELELDETRLNVVKSTVELCQMAEGMWQHLDSFSGELQKLDERMKQNDIRLSKTEALRDLPINEVEQAVASVSELVRLQSGMSDVRGTLDQLPQIKQEYLDTLAEGLDIVTSQETILRRIERLHTEKADLDRRRNDLPKEVDTSQLDTEGLADDIKRINLLISEMDRLTQNAKAQRLQEEKAIDAQERESKALEDLLHALHDIEICPTCGQATENVDEHAAQHAIQS